MFDTNEFNFTNGMTNNFVWPGKHVILVIYMYTNYYSTSSTDVIYRTIAAMAFHSNTHVHTDGLPYDGLPREEVISIHPSLTAIVALLVAVGLTFSVVCIVFNIVFRKRK